MIKNQKVLYLDFDGVLHNHDVWVGFRGQPQVKVGWLFQYAELLERALTPYPDVKIVLCTSWVPEVSYINAVGRLRDALAKRCIGATWHSYMRKINDDDYYEVYDGLTRFGQIYKDLHRRRPFQFLALDDDAIGWPVSERSWLVESDHVLALGNSNVLYDLEVKLLRRFGGKEDFPIPNVNDSLFLQSYMKLPTREYVSRISEIRQAV